MSGEYEELHADWKTKLASYRGKFPRELDGDEIGGFKANRNQRRGTSSLKRVIDPFGEEVVINVRRRDHSGKSRDVDLGVESPTERPEDVGGTTAGNVKGDEVPIMSKSSDQPQSDENREGGEFQGGRSYRRSRDAEGESRYNEEVYPTPEEQEVVRAKEARIKKGVKLALLTAGSVAVMSAAAVLGMGLLGKHKSNIMNM